MERTGTNGRRLIQILKRRGYTGRGTSGELSEGHISNIRSRSRRCSLVLAVAINELTGVPIKALIEWPTVRKGRTSRVPDQETVPV